MASRKKAPPARFSANSAVATGSARHRPKTTKAAVDARRPAASSKGARPARDRAREVEGRVGDTIVLLLEGVIGPAPRLRHAVQCREHDIALRRREE